MRKPTLLVSPTDIVLAFPPESITEVNDYAWDTSKTLTNRGVAQQINYALKGNRDLDVLSDTFNSMLNFLLAEIPSYNEEANNISLAYDLYFLFPIGFVLMPSFGWSGAEKI